MMATELALSKVLHVRRPPAPSRCAAPASPTIRTPRPRADTCCACFTNRTPRSSPRPDASSETPRAARSRHANLEGGKPQSMPRMQDVRACPPQYANSRSASPSRVARADRASPASRAPRSRSQLMAALPHEDGPASTSRARRGGAGRLFSPDTPGGTRKVRGSGAWGDPALGYMGTPSAGRRQASAARDSLSLAWDEAGERPSTAPAQSGMNGADSGQVPSWCGGFFFVI
ncbi:hypothetical protein T492DRAFT_203889 [Pavlovales sp. CCMP2436]|nr:hypothetical protein T492DRAFT_203889 [Pavlovales sp. CCMP2436]